MFLLRPVFLLSQIFYTPSVLEEEPDLEKVLSDHISNFARNRETFSEEQCIENCCIALHGKINEFTSVFHEHNFSKIKELIDLFSSIVEEEYFLDNNEKEKLVSSFKYALSLLIEARYANFFAGSYYSTIKDIDSQQCLQEVKVWAEQFFICVNFLDAICFRTKLIRAQSLLHKTECAFSEINNKIIQNRLGSLLSRLEKNASSILSEREEAFVKQSIAGDFPFITEHRKAMVSIIWHEYTCQVCHVSKSNFRDKVFSKALIPVQKVKNVHF